MDKIKAKTDIINQFEEKIIIKGNYYELIDEDDYDKKVAIIDDEGIKIVLCREYFEMEDMC